MSTTNVLTNSNQFHNKDWNIDLEVRISFPLIELTWNEKDNFLDLLEKVENVLKIYSSKDNRFVNADIRIPKDADTVTYLEEKLEEISALFEESGGDRNEIRTDPGFSLDTGGHPPILCMVAQDRKNPNQGTLLTFIDLINSEINELFSIGEKGMEEIKNFSSEGIFPYPKTPIRRNGKNTFHIATCCPIEHIENVKGTINTKMIITLITIQTKRDKNQNNNVVDIQVDVRTGKYVGGVDLLQNQTKFLWGLFNIDGKNDMPHSSMNSKRKLRDISELWKHVKFLLENLTMSSSEVEGTIELDSDEVRLKEEESPSPKKKTSKKKPKKETLDETKEETLEESEEKSIDEMPSEQVKV